MYIKKTTTAKTKIIEMRILIIVFISAPKDTLQLDQLILKICVVPILDNAQNQVEILKKQNSEKTIQCKSK